MPIFLSVVEKESIILGKNLNEIETHWDYFCVFKVDELGVTKMVRI